MTGCGAWGTEPGKRLLNGGQRNVYQAPIRPGDVVSVTRRFVDVVERETKRGPMVFFTSEFRWENQDGALVRIGEQTTIYYCPSAEVPNTSAATLSASFAAGTPA